MSDLAKRLSKWAADYGSQEITNINDTTKQFLADAISKAIDSGSTIDEMSKMIDTIFDALTGSGIEGYRAERIARTETMVSVNTGAFTTYDLEGYSKIEWLATLDDDTRESHAELNGQIVNINEPFDNGLLYPCDPSGDPGEIINCRCTILPVGD